MQSFSLEMLQAAQRARLSDFSATASVDIHCHCLPNVDDGPATLEASVEFCRILVLDGITHAIATPHQLGPFSGSNGRLAILEAISSLRAQLAVHQIPLVIEPGADVRIDEQLIKLLDVDEVLTLADGKAYILLEFPHETLIDPMLLLQQLSDRGIVGIISHPERQAQISRKPELVVPWIRAGALLQVTSASLLGEFGPIAHSAAWRLIEVGAVSLIASDAHDITKRPPRMTHAIRAVSKKLGHAVARRLCIENPHKVLLQQPIQSPRIMRRFGGEHA